MSAQLFAVIKKSSKYVDQQPRDERGRVVPFPVEVVDDCSYPLRGNENNYRISDVNFFVRVREQFVKLS